MGMYNRSLRKLDTRVSSPSEALTDNLTQGILVLQNRYVKVVRFFLRMCTLRPADRILTEPDFSHIPPTKKGFLIDILATEVVRKGVD